MTRTSETRKTAHFVDGVGELLDERAQTGDLLDRPFLRAKVRARPLSRWATERTIALQTWNQRRSGLMSQIPGRQLTSSRNFRTCQSVAWSSCGLSWLLRGDKKGLDRLDSLYNGTYTYGSKPEPGWARSAIPCTLSISRDSPSPEPGSWNSIWRSASSPKPRSLPPGPPRACSRMPRVRRWTRLRKSRSTDVVHGLVEVADACLGDMIGGLAQERVHEVYESASAPGVAITCRRKRNGPSPPKVPVTSGGAGPEGVWQTMPSPTWQKTSRYPRRRRDSSHQFECAQRSSSV